MKQVIQKFSRNELFVAILLIFCTTAITYGVNIPKFGYYFDDWYLLWSGQSRGAASIIPLFSTDRPFMGVVYSQVYRLLGDAYINWHLYALLWRLIGGLAFFWILRLIWPNHRYVTTMMSVLFVIYPGFLSQPDANTKQNHLYGFGTALLSIAFMLQGLRTKRIIGKVIYSLSSIVLTVNYVFIYEYMMGLEGMRLIVLGYVLFRENLTNIRYWIIKILKIWWPYPIVLSGFLYWRVFIFESSRNATDLTRLTGSYLGDLRHMSVRLVFETAKDFLDAAVFAWFVKPYSLLASTTYSNLGRALLITGIVIVLVLTYSWLLKKWWGIEHDDGNHQLIKDFVWIGGLILLCAILPVVLSGRQIDLYDAYKSYGLHPIAGVVLLIVGIVLMFQSNFRGLILVALIGISVSTQILNGDYWGQLWDYQREMWWQLTWRAPDIKDDTLVMAYLPEGYRVQQDYEVWGPVNLIYRPGPAKIPSIQSEVLNTETAYDVLRGNVRSDLNRDIRLNRDFNNLLLITLPSGSSCIHVLDGTLPVYSESESLLVQQIGEYSHIDRIVPSGKSPMPSPRIFGSEPEHDWCYYYQKASLARQTGDWVEIGRLYDRVSSLGLKANDKAEVIPFFEGLVNLGRYDDAKTLYEKDIKGHARMRFPLCTFLSVDPNYPPQFSYDYKSINEILCNS